MKRWLIPVTIVALMIAGATAGAFASGGGDRNPAPESSDEASTQPGCDLGTLECDDTPDTCEPVALRSDCGIDPDV